MVFYPRDDKRPENRSGQTERDLLDCRERNRFMLDVVRSLLVFLKDFTLDLKEKEIGTQRFKENLDQLADSFTSEMRTRKLAGLYRRQRKQIYAYITRQKDYLQARETELKDIIDLLSRAMAALDADNQVFNQTIYRQTEKIENLTHLDDIRKIKDALSEGVNQLQSEVRKKKTRDSQRLEKLSRRVSALNQELEATRRESLTDSLTGVHNRKALDGFMADMVDRCRRGRSSFSMLLLDIDDFKSFNDTYGHQVGDRVLVAVAQQCKAVVRRDDFVGRYGGEEFAVILPGASLRNARKRAEKLCRKIAAARYELRQADARHVINVTVSIGVSAFDRQDTVETVTARADKALYAAKGRGKNCVCTQEDLQTRQVPEAPAPSTAGQRTDEGRSARADREKRWRA